MDWEHYESSRVYEAETGYPVQSHLFVNRKTGETKVKTGRVSGKWIPRRESKTCLRNT